jgi:hypothetical protein
MSGICGIFTVTMSAPEYADLHPEPNEIEGRVLGAAKLVVASLAAEFTPLSPDEIQQVNTNHSLLGQTAVLQTGSLRILDAVDTERQSPVQVSETYYNWMDHGEPFVAHSFNFVLEDSQQQYQCVIDLDSDEIALIAIEELREVPDDQSEILYEKIHGSLTLVADSLIFAA